MKLEDYLSLPYTMMVRWSADDELFVARVREIDDCTGHGATEGEALSMLRENLEDRIAFSLERGETVPLPLEGEDLPSGKWLQRVPRTLHRRLVECATKEGVSLNSYVTVCLASAVGRVEGAASYESVSPIIPDIQARAYAVTLSAHKNLEALLPFYGGAPSIHIRGISMAQQGSSSRSPNVQPLIAGGNYPLAYQAFVHSVAEQIPNRIVEKRERTGRDKKEEEHFAYA